jgi:hypothetical protein
MSEVIDLAHFAQQRESSANTTFAVASSAHESAWYRQVEVFGGGSLLSAGVLRKLNIDSELGRFVGLVQDALERLSGCKMLWLAGDALGADDQFIACKPILTEMFMFRDLSDSVGLIVLKCFQVAASVRAIVDAPELPSVMERALTRVRSAPFMPFGEACALADEIESSAVLSEVPGFPELSNELVQAAGQPALTY